MTQLNAAREYKEWMRYNRMRFNHRDEIIRTLLYKIEELEERIEKLELA